MISFFSVWKQFKCFATMNAVSQQCERIKNSMKCHRHNSSGRCYAYVTIKIIYELVRLRRFYVCFFVFSFFRSSCLSHTLTLKSRDDRASWRLTIQRRKENQANLCQRRTFFVRSHRRTRAHRSSLWWSDASSFIYIEVEMEQKTREK